MRIRVSTEGGSALLITLLGCVIIGITLASYLDLVSFQNRSTMRSLKWNTCIPVIEAGIEEALVHLNTNTDRLESDGWTLRDTFYTLERNLGENKFVAKISTDAKPEILVSAYVLAPMSTEYLPTPRTVKVTTHRAALFAKGMVAKGSIDLSGNNIKSDSFNSSDPNYSTDGQYDPTKALANGDIATNSGVIDSLDVGNAEIYGKVSTGPGGTVSLGANGAVGSKEWHDANNTGVEPGYKTDDMNVYFPDVKAPWDGSAFEPLGGNVDGVNYTYVLTSGNWELSSLSLSGQQKVLVTGDATLYVRGDVSMSGQSTIQIQPGASLAMYVGGPSTSMHGNGIANREGNALAFQYYGLPTNTSIAIGGNASITGVIYAPQAAMTLGGGGSDTHDIVGSTVTDSVKMNGKFNFHYDESLLTNGPRRGFVIDSWNEIIGYDIWDWDET